MSNNQKILRLHSVKEWTGLSRSTIYAMSKKGIFPKPIQLGARAVGWTTESIQTWIESRINSTEA